MPRLRGLTDGIPTVMLDRTVCQPEETGHTEDHCSPEDETAHVVIVPRWVVSGKYPRTGYTARVGSVSGTRLEADLQTDEITFSGRRISFTPPPIRISARGGESIIRRTPVIASTHWADRRTIPSVR